MGVSTRTCVSSGPTNGTWNSTAPNCRCKLVVQKLSLIDIVPLYNIVLCPVTGDTLSNGMVSYSDSRMPIVAGAMATYTCDTGYTLDGAATRTCVENTGWNITEFPTCNSELVV